MKSSTENAITKVTKTPGRDISRKLNSSWKICLRSQNRLTTKMGQLRDVDRIV
jgi:hypothetical protein